MLDFLIQKYIVNYEQTHKPSVRKAYGNLAGTIGIITNVILSIIKLSVGYMSGSIAIISDGFHNLVDVISAGSNIISFKLAGREPDFEHPYGHGRIEYLFSIGVSILIISVGIQFFIESIQKILHPTPMQMTLGGMILFAISIVGTLQIWITYKTIGKKINSSVLEASGAECFSDIIVSTVILVGLIISMTSKWQLDGYLGVFAAIVICHTGYTIFKENTSTLIGNEPSTILVSDITKFVRSYDGVLGVHDLMIHDYGPGRQFATIHVEVDAKVAVIKSHELIDRIEKEIEEKLGIKLTIHMDPLVRNENTLRTYYAINEIIQKYDPTFSIHDVRLVQAYGKINIFFDLVVPFRYKKSHKEIRREISDLIYDLNPLYECNIKIEECYTGLEDIHTFQLVDHNK